jgi:hypothetical protein
MSNREGKWKENLDFKTVRRKIHGRVSEHGKALRTH